MKLQMSYSKKIDVELSNSLKRASTSGNIRVVKRIIAISAYGEGKNIATIASTLKICVQSVHNWVKSFILNRFDSLELGKSSGRPSKLTKKQRKELSTLIENGPSAAGFPGGVWRSPMIQALIFKKFKVFFSVAYIAELLKNIGFSFQKAKFEAARSEKNEAERKKWTEETWPKLIEFAEKMDAHILFGDEASFPQWGTLNYTWAKKGQQPIVQTSGKRKGYKVFGLIDYFTGNSYFSAQEERLNSESYETFLKMVLKKTRKHIILIQDGARYHTSKEMKAFFKEKKNRLTVVTLPAYSPDFNPIEKLWKNIKQKGTHLHYFPTFEDLKNKVHEMIDIFKDSKKEVLGLFGFYETL
jgi:transposase